MEIEKAARIVATCIAIMSLGIWIATMVFFPATSLGTRILPLIILIWGLWQIWHKRCPKRTKYE